MKDTGMVSGITTNPLLIAHSGKTLKSAIKEIASIFTGPISAEVNDGDVRSMLSEAEELSSISSNINIKIPLTMDGLVVCKKLREMGVDVNITLCFSPIQALLAAKMDATYISVFVGRCEDNGYDSESILYDVRDIYDRYEFNTQILVASVRSIGHVLMAAKIGADAITIPPKILYQMYSHYLTADGIDSFNKASAVTCASKEAPQE